MYDQQKAVGVPGALLNLKTLTADELLVQNEANVAADTKNSMIDRAKALATLTAFTYIEAHKNAVCAYKQAYKEIVQSIKSIFK